MSNPEVERPDLRALERLEDAVDGVIERLEGLEERVRRSEAKRRELEEVLERFRTGNEAPADLARRAERLADENQELRRRLGDGRQVVERIRARIRFLEEQG